MYQYKLYLNANSLVRRKATRWYHVITFFRTTLLLRRSSLRDIRQFSDDRESVVSAKNAQSSYKGERFLQLMALRALLLSFAVSLFLGSKAMFSLDSSYLVVLPLASYKCLCRGHTCRRPETIPPTFECPSLPHCLHCLAANLVFSCLRLQQHQTLFHVKYKLIPLHSQTTFSNISNFIKLFHFHQLISFPAKFN